MGLEVGRRIKFETFVAEGESGRRRGGRRGHHGPYSERFETVIERNSCLREFRSKDSTLAIMRETKDVFLRVCLS